MKLPSSFYNPTSLIGSVLAGAAIIIFVFTLLAMSLLGVGGSYLGLFVYIILPIFLILGLILIPVGIVRRRKKMTQLDLVEAKKGFVLDLNDKKHFNGVLIFIIGTFLFLLLTGIGSYEAFHYTESNEFCGKLCHEVMEPEYVAYQGSSHSRVKCVECHIGEGADWFVKSKITGLYQVYAVLGNIYPKPIPTPIENLRPARETCENCHWPEKFYSNRIETEKHFIADSGNTPWNIQLKMKLGAEHSTGGLHEGIHWHINPDIQVQYVSSDEDREIIPWVRYINVASGDTVIYNDTYNELAQEAFDTLEVRTMDCMDCHNRPSHKYLPPQKYIDDQLASGKISPDLAWVKSMAMQSLNTEYPTLDSAESAISMAVSDYFEMNYPEMAGGIEEDSTYSAIWESYKKNNFPRMKVTWTKYPDHIGHLEFNGCFRCHNGQHMDEGGNVISDDCNLCHTIIGQGTPDNFMSTGIDQSLEFVHPVDIGEAWKEMACSECHSFLY